MPKNGRKKRKLESFREEIKKTTECIKQMDRWKKLAKCDSLERVVIYLQLALELKLERLKIEYEKLQSQIEGNK